MHARNKSVGDKLLAAFFDKDASIRVDAHMVEGAVHAGNPSNLRTLLQYDRTSCGAQPRSYRQMTIRQQKVLQVTEEILKNAAYSHGHELALTEYFLDHCSPKLTTQDVVLAAVGR